MNEASDQHLSFFEQLGHTYLNVHVCIHFLLYFTGEQGDFGDSGVGGPLSEGDKGEMGPKGEDGEQGDTGDDGLKGDVGERGKRSVSIRTANKSFEQ